MSQHRLTSTLKTVFCLCFMASKARRLRSIPHPGDAVSWEPLGTTARSWLLSPHYPCTILRQKLLLCQLCPPGPFFPVIQSSEQLQGKEGRALCTGGDNADPTLLSPYYTPWGLSRFAMLHFSPLHKRLQSCKSVISCT